MDRATYFNELLARLEEVCLQELSWCAPWKLDFVGTDFIKKKITGGTPGKVLDSCVQAIKAGGLVEDISYTIAGKGVLLKLDIKGCVHLPMEAKLKADKIKPFMCPIANIITDQLIKVLNYETSYLADLNIDNKTGKCVVKCGIYADIDKVGEVSDWQSV